MYEYIHINITVLQQLGVCNGAVEMVLVEASPVVVRFCNFYLLIFFLKTEEINYYRIMKEHMKKYKFRMITDTVFP